MLRAQSEAAEGGRVADVLERCARRSRVCPSISPFALQAIEGLPFDEDSEEARAIREVIEQAEYERSEASRKGSSRQRG